MKQRIKHTLIESCLNDLLQPGMVAWDIGTNGGRFALRMGQLVGRSGTVYAFEQSARHHHSLNCKITAYGLEQIITPRQITMLNGDGPAAPQSLKMQHANPLVATGKSCRPAIGSAVTWQVDALVFEHGYSAPDLLKIDMLGSETAIVAGMQRLLSDHTPTMIIATEKESAREIADLLAPSNYLVRHAVSGYDGGYASPTHLIFEPEPQFVARLNL